jgi:hypothetical protein
MREDVQVHEGNHLFSYPRGVTMEEVKQWTLGKHSKGVVYVYAPPQLLAHHARYSTGYGNCIQNRSHDLAWACQSSEF